MPRGRKPIPRQLKLLRGNPGKRPVPAAKPEPAPELPRCPRHLDRQARREWRRLARELHALGLLTALDRAALAGYCCSWSRWLTAEAALAASGPVLWNHKAQCFYPNPYLRVAQKALEQMKSFLTEFGMTPSARMRVAMAPPPTEADPLSEFLAG